MHPATKQLDGQMQPTSLPSSLTGTPNVLSTPPYATKQLDDTVITSHTAAQPTAETPPPSSLTVRGSSPAAKTRVDCNHWSQQLPAHESPCQTVTKAYHVHAPSKQSQNPGNVHQIAHGFFPQTHERDRSLTLHYATRITRYNKVHGSRMFIHTR